ncbi:CinA family nicotinamide mononucleotide deamidase-related protein [Celerinatantimonas diazotrophica]|uniref:CinA-like protein n=1 Tax=Celerinatantimonas diazotrophica TaxID=412034 RepID=A0A4R1J9Q0_9GAMM|nr:CinA family nicotinamide mononucleotide deamidase-related protein [Celerinatantimonas diazotrophica]TCK47240.1 competence/damage-inducible protein cinA [Celerinatantimonas diazotrophica]CAG9296012.1 Nicotinamide-nucleotide amidohydrolase PncC [Celerinatantimonas diazotrophica]
MIIEMLSTGDEVLQGDIVDTNAAWAGQQLAERGLKFSRRQTVADDLATLVEVMDECCQRADWLLVNGGLGPTSDDLSAEAAGKLLGVPLELNQQWVANMQQWYRQKQREMPPSNLKQAMLPQGAELIDNPVGTACGFIITHHQCHVLFTPGVPSEFKHMLSHSWLPRLSDGDSTRVKRFFAFGLSESGLAQQLADIELPAGVRLGFRAARPSIEVKVFSQKVLTPEIKRVYELIRAQLKEQLFSEDNGNWAEFVQHKMIAKGLKLTCAESCTGGMLASQLVSVPGSSAYFERGFVTYTNQAKVQMLGVSSQLLEHYGAVSVEVAQAMAKGALAHSEADLALSITGIAGPDGGSDDKPVGTVCFALATAQSCFTQRLLLTGRTRQAIRETAAATALDMLRRYLNEQPIWGDYDLIRRIQTEQS